MFSILETQEHQLVGMISNTASMRVPRFTKGKQIADNFENGQLKVELESDHEFLPDYFELDATPIVSGKFVELWQKLPFDNYQLFPITVKLPSREIKDYSILNIVGRISCIDMEKSDCNMYEHRIMRLNNLVLDYKSIKESNLFRAHEYPLAIFISDSIAEKLSDSGLSGMLINPAENWNDQHRF